MALPDLVDRRQTQMEHASNQGYGLWSYTDEELMLFVDNLLRRIEACTAEWIRLASNQSNTPIQ